MSERVVSSKRSIFPEEDAVPICKQLKLSNMGFKVSENTQIKAATLFAKGLVAGSVPLRIVEGRHMNELFTLLNVPKLSDRCYLADTVLPQLYNEIRQEQVNILNEAKDVTIILDSWTDVSRISYTALILQFIQQDERRMEYIGNIELEERHTGENLAKATIALVNNFVSSESVVGIATDSAANMRVMKEILISSQYTAAFSIPCVLHVLNLVTGDFLKSTYKSQVKTINEVAAFFIRSNYYSKKLKEWGAANNVPGQIVSFSPTRWFGFYTTCKSIAKFYPSFSEIFPVLNVPPKVRTSLFDDFFLPNIKIIMDVLHPIISAIVHLENNNASVFDVWPHILTIMETLRTMIMNSSSNKLSAVLTILQALKKRLAFFDNDLYVVALFLNLKFRYIATSGKYDCNKIKSMLLNILKKFNISKPTVIKILAEFNLYYEAKSPFKKSNDYNEFWTEVSDCSLKDIALRLINIVPHFTGFERLFSTMSYIKKK